MTNQEAFKPLLDSYLESIQDGKYLPFCTHIVKPYILSEKNLCCEKISCSYCYFLMAQWLNDDYIEKECDDDEIELKEQIQTLQEKDWIGVKIGNITYLRQFHKYSLVTQQVEYYVANAEEELIIKKIPLNQVTILTPTQMMKNFNLVETPE